MTQQTVEQKTFQQPPSSNITQRLERASRLISSDGNLYEIGNELTEIALNTPRATLDERSTAQALLNKLTEKMRPAAPSPTPSPKDSVTNKDTAKTSPTIKSKSTIIVTIPTTENEQRNKNKEAKKNKSACDDSNDCELSQELMQITESRFTSKKNTFFNDLKPRFQSFFKEMKHGLSKTTITQLMEKAALPIHNYALKKIFLDQARATLEIRGILEQKKKGYTDD